MAVLRVNAAAAQFYGVRAQGPQTGQVKLGVAVGAAHALGLRRRQNTVGAHHLARWHIAHQQVFAVVIEKVDVISGLWRMETGTHFCGKNIKSQALGLSHFVLVACPGHFNTAAARAYPLPWACIVCALRRTAGQRRRRQGQRGAM